MSHVRGKPIPCFRGRARLTICGLRRAFALLSPSRSRSSLFSPCPSLPPSCGHGLISGRVVACSSKTVWSIAQFVKCGALTPEGAELRVWGLEGLGPLSSKSSVERGCVHARVLASVYLKVLLFTLSMRCRAYRALVECCRDAKLTRVHSVVEPCVTLEEAITTSTSLHSSRS